MTIGLRLLDACRPLTSELRVRARAQQIRYRFDLFGTLGNSASTSFRAEERRSSAKGQREQTRSFDSSLSWPNVRR
jgi:hypothetical protein